MPQTEFIVVRHGETAWNVEGRIQGHLDTPLNDEGLAQALMVGERLAREPFDAFYCSDLLRTRQTAQPLMDRTRRVPQLQSELRERHLGIFQGLTGAQCQQQFPEDYRRFHERDPDHVIPEGESVRQLYERITTFFADLPARQPHCTWQTWPHKLWGSVCLLFLPITRWCWVRHVSKANSMTLRAPSD